MNNKVRAHTPRWRSAVLAVAASALLTVPLSAQNSSMSGNAARPMAGGYSTFDLDIFFGTQWFQIGQGTTNSVKKFEPALTWGETATWDFSKYLGLEASIQSGYNKMLIQPTNAHGYAELGGKSTAIWSDAILHLTPRESVYRPFILVGPGYTWYYPGDPAKLKIGSSTLVPVGPLPPLKTSGETALHYGIGMQINASPRWGVRIDLGGSRTGQPHFNFPGIPGGPGTLYIPAAGHENSLTYGVGFVFRLKYHAPPVERIVTPIVTPPAPMANLQLGAITGGQDACAGDTVRLQVTASGWLPEQTPSYQWMVNGSPVSGATSSSFSLPTVDGAGAKVVTVSVSAGSSSKTSDAVTVNVRPLAPPTIQFTISPSTVPYGTKINLAANATGSACGGPATVRFSGEGVTGNVLDTSALSFDQSNRLRQQSRTVHVTATATDQKNQTASAGADVTVTLNASARRLDDIVFPNMSSRVNNCAKRLLLEELTPMLRNDPGAKVVLIGHRDTMEKGKASASLDEARVINAAAVLSAGKGICPSLDLSRIMVNWVGTEQGSDTRPALCGSSTNVKEKGGASVKDTDKRAMYRRVEIWVIPSGADMPSNLSGLKDAPASIKTKGCPK